MEESEPISDTSSDFLEYLRTFGVQLQNEPGEYNRRLDIFQQNVADINERNKQNRTYKEGLTHFAHWTDEEFISWVGKGLLKPKISKNIHSTNYNLQDEIISFGSPWHYASASEILPSSFDWRSQGAVTNVKYQGQCGGCVAFTVTSSIESAYYIRYGKFPYMNQAQNNFTSAAFNYWQKPIMGLSEQQIVSCNFLNDGCEGGLNALALIYAAVGGGVVSEANDPYTSSDYVNVSNPTATCPLQLPKPDPNVSTDPYNSFTLVNPAIKDVMSAVIKQPVLATMWAPKEFLNYKNGGGVFTCPSPKQPNDHAVVIVGYGTENGKDYWLVKNSWGSLWGESGYAKVDRSDEDSCNILNMDYMGQPSYPNMIQLSGPSSQPTLQPTLSPSAPTSMVANGGFLLTTPLSIHASMYSSTTDITFLSATLSGTAVNGNEIPAIVCPSTLLHNPNDPTEKYFIAAGVYQGSTYASTFSLISLNPTNDLAVFAVTASNAFNTNWRIPINLPLSCQTLAYLGIAGMNSNQWQVAGGKQALSNNDIGLGIKNLIYVNNYGVPTYSPSTKPTSSSVVSPSSSPPISPPPSTNGISSSEVSQPTASNSSNVSSKLIIASLVSCILIILSLGGLWLWLRKRSQHLGILPLQSILQSSPTHQGSGASSSSSTSSAPPPSVQIVESPLQINSLYDDNNKQDDSNKEKVVIVTESEASTISNADFVQNPLSSRRQSNLPLK